MTRARLIGFGVLLLVLALGYWIMTNTQWIEEKVALPLKGEAAEDPYYGARFLATQLGAHALTLQHVDTPPPQHGTLVLSSGFWNLFPTTGDSLRTWVHAGGHLVLDANLLGGEGLEWVDVKREWPRDEDEEEDGEEEGETTEDEAPDMEDDDESAAQTPAREKPECFALQISEPSATPALRDSPAKVCTGLYSRLVPGEAPDWTLESSLGPEAVRYVIGRGKVTVFNSAMPITHRGPTNLSHAWYFVLITDLKPGDTIWFAPFEDSPTLLKLMWRYGAEVIVVALLALALALWRAAPRFGPLMAPSHSTRRSLRDQIVGSGAFAGRVSSGEVLLKAQTQALESSARRRLPGYDALTPQERIAALAHACQLKPTQLAQAMKPEAGRPSPLAHRLITLENARRRLTTLPPHH